MHSHNKEQAVDIYQFAEGYRLKDVLYAYVDSYMEDHQDILPRWHAHDGRRVFQSLDGAAVTFELDNTVFGELGAIRKVGSLGNVIINSIIGCAAYFLSQGKAAEVVPDQLRIALSICHNNDHWTGLVVKVEDFKNFYQGVREYWLANKDGQFKGYNLSAVGSAANVILDHVLGLSRNYRQPELVRKLQPFFEGKIAIDHYDSFYTESHYKRVQASLEQLHKIIGLKINTVPCSVQRGHTCGDHTIVNIMMASLMGVVPEIGHTVTSKSLRHLTEMVGKKEIDRKEKIEQARLLIRESVPAPVQAQSVSEKEEVQKPAVLEKKPEASTNKPTRRLEKKPISKTKQEGVSADLGKASAGLFRKPVKISSTSGSSGPKIKAVIEDVKAFIGKKPRK